MAIRKKQDTIREYGSMRRTTCCNCPAGCGLKVFLNGDTIVDIYGDEEHPINKGAFCTKGLLSYFHLKNLLMYNASDPVALEKGMPSSK